MFILHHLLNPSSISLKFKFSSRIPGNFHQEINKIILISQGLHEQVRHHKNY